MTVGSMGAAPKPPTEPPDHPALSGVSDVWTLMRCLIERPKEIQEFIEAYHKLAEKYGKNVAAYKRDVAAFQESVRASIEAFAAAEAHATATMDKANAEATKALSDKTAMIANRDAELTVKAEQVSKAMAALKIEEDRIEKKKAEAESEIEDLHALAVSHETEANKILEGLRARAEQARKLASDPVV